METQAIFDERQARSATTKEEAEEQIRAFIREGFEPISQHNVSDKSHGFDFYLPWMMEIIEYVKSDTDAETLGILQLQRLYLDTAWSLVMKGVLRPGPKVVTGASGGNYYGVAFSVVEGAEV